MKTGIPIKDVIVFLITGILLLQNFPGISAQFLGSFSTLVAMQERDLTVTVYYYRGCEEWGKHIFDITVEALPILEELAGFPYPCEFDVEIYPKKSEEVSGWGAQNLMEKGIWLNRDTYTTEMVKSGDIDGTVIHENAHYWASDAIYGNPWLKEGYAELFTYLTFERMGREEDASSKKRRWASGFEKNRYYNIPLDAFEYQSAGPSNETTALAYSKSALFCYEMYEQYGLGPLQEINRVLHRTGIAADSRTYLNLLEVFTGESQKELFVGWVYPNHIDTESWQKAENKIDELQELTEYAIQYIEENYGFHVHISTSVGYAKACIRKFEFEEALNILDREIERVTDLFSGLDEYTLKYIGSEKDVTSKVVTIEQLLTVLQEYGSTEKELENIDFFTISGIFLQHNKDNYRTDLVFAQEEIKKGNIENALSILSYIHEEISKARRYGIGIVTGVGMLVLSFALVLVRKRKKK